MFIVRERGLFVNIEQCPFANTVCDDHVHFFCISEHVQKAGAMWSHFATSNAICRGARRDRCFRGSEVTGIEIKNALIYWNKVLVLQKFLLVLLIFKISPSITSIKTIGYNKVLYLLI